MLDWNDLRFLLATAETGSTLSAGRRLGVSQTTAARRLIALEEGLGLPLFERRPSGYRLTEQGAALLPLARAVAREALAFEEAASASRRDASGTVRLTVAEIYAITLLPPMLRDLNTLHPAIRIELDTSGALRDLGAGDADIAVRTVARPQGSGLVARRVQDDPWGVYCSRAYAAAHGRPRTRRDLAGHLMVGGGEGPVWSIYRRWLEDNGLTGQVAIQQDSSAGLLAAVRAGIGIAALPCVVADQEPDLLRCLPPDRSQGRALWLVTHERVRHAPRVRAVLDFLGDRLSRLRPVHDD